MTTDFTVRPARPADARPLAELCWRFQQEDHAGQPPDPDRPLEEAEHWIRHRLGDGRWLVWVAETGGELCGHRSGGRLLAVAATGHRRGASGAAAPTRQFWLTGQTAAGSQRSGHASR
ncbi:hypothetical protein [Streptomyces benahoarensis]|uniref:hypothetical protein n=1 Tax=Streptomyces benahoarensis TaxID=2595054 RepID=UPI00163DB2EB|nr:hypothetical protein [Streptomyces benahoarensis]